MDYYKTYRDQVKFELDRTQELLDKKLLEKEEIDFEIALLNNNSARILREYSDPLSHFNLDKILRDFNNDKKVFVNKESKSTLSFIENNYFFESTVKPKLIETYFCGITSMATQAYGLVYQIGKIKFRITIPLYKIADSESYKKLYYELYNQDSEHSYTLIFRTRFVEEMAPAIKKYLEEKLK